MYPKLLHLYGPFELNSFNALIMLGIVVFIRMALKHPGREKYIASDDFINLTFEATLAGIIGGRTLHVLSEWNQYHSLLDMLSIWKGGMSILGALIGVLIYTATTVIRKKIAPLALFDIAALYAPLIHGIARIGCFLTGCCYGAHTLLPWGVTYTHPLVMAPLHLKIHPTQLYSSLVYLLLFILLQRLSHYYQLNTGRLLMFYLIGMSFERFFIDFFRGDRIMVHNAQLSFLSFHQWIALGILLCSIAALIYLERKDPKLNPSST